MLTDEERARRRNYIGASDVPALFGLGFESLRDQNDLYWSKVATLPEQRGDELTLGNLLEGLLCDWAAARLGVKGIRNHWCAATDGIFAATLDAHIVGTGQAIEAKYSGETDLWGAEGTDEVPERVVLQTQAQCYVAELERVWVPVALVVAQRLQLRLYCVPRHDELINLIVERGRRFWREHIEPRVPPGPTTTPPLAVLKTMQREPNSTVALDEEAAPILGAYLEAKRVLDEAEAQKQDCYAAVVALLGDAEAGRLSDGTLVTYLAQKGAPSCDHAQLRALHPDIYQEFFRQGTYRVLRVKQPKQSKGGK